MAVRAEPVSALYERGKIQHVGRFAKLEEQLCSFTTAGYVGDDSPDHGDAAIWPLTDLMLGAGAPEVDVGMPVQVPIGPAMGDARYSADAGPMPSADVSGRGFSDFRG